MYKKLIIILAIVLITPFETQTHVYEDWNKKQTGTLIYIGPTIRLMYEFTPDQWSKLGLKLQLDQIRLDSICYTQEWLGPVKTKFKKSLWERKIKDGTDASRLWGVDSLENFQSDILSFANILCISNVGD